MKGIEFLMTLGMAIVVSTKNLDDIISEKRRLLEKDLNTMLGSDIVLTDKEQKANEIVMDLKRREVDYGFDHPNFFNLSKHFFAYKDEVKQSPLFKIIQEMPKGAILHAHDTGILSPDYLMKITYQQNLYVCFMPDDISLLFSKKIPDRACCHNPSCTSKWTLMSKARSESGDVQEFDANLRKHFTMVVDDPDKEYPDINTAWAKFSGYYLKTSSMLRYKPVWEQYFFDTLKALRDDNVMYLEIRSVLPDLYDLEGNTFDAVETAVSYHTVLTQFKEQFPDFFGARLIYAPIRMVKSGEVEVYLKTARAIKEKLPDLFAGFDLVGQEDLGTPLKDFLPVLAQAVDEFDCFFHAGETNWYGTNTDENLYDAVALGAKRIGHGYAIAKHPELINEIKKRDIALEVNVVSNSVLKLVHDVRNHPLASFLAQGLPVVISSDDPGIWEADPMSHDFYVMFVGVSCRHADLRLLKKLALNSLYYSTALNKSDMIKEFEFRWIHFIDIILKDNKLFKIEL